MVEDTVGISMIGAGSWPAGISMGRPARPP